MGNLRFLEVLDSQLQNRSLSVDDKRMVYELMEKVNMRLYDATGHFYMRPTQTQVN